MTGSDDAAVREALAVLAGGGVVGYPSETVWGLAALPGYLPGPSRSASPFFPAGVERLYRLKGRDSLKPVQLSCSSASVARTWTNTSDPQGTAFERLSGLWPGPLTLLARAAAGCPEALAPGGVVGLRVPAHPLALALLEAAGGTLATTSLNPSGAPAATTRSEAAAYGLADLLLCDPAKDGRVSGRASTVYDLMAGVIVRQGDLSEAQVRAALG
ncbi:L-threonylcarbamoyladenylate synthase [Deinococcus sp.]|uniref:L-threonylcarbamoyladenylate synthase n=1 Tax=Deinococcus sp. TaxID=47478 RepID=UPI003CC50330